MTYDELLTLIKRKNHGSGMVLHSDTLRKSLRAIVELHKVKPGVHKICFDCSKLYPCPTIKAIEKELK